MLGGWNPGLGAHAAANNATQQTTTHRRTRTARPSLQQCPARLWSVVMPEASERERHYSVASASSPGFGVLDLM